MIPHRQQFFIEGSVLTFVAVACFVVVFGMPQLTWPTLQYIVMLLSGGVGIVAGCYAIKAGIMAFLSGTEDSDPSALTGSQN